MYMHDTLDSAFSIYYTRNIVLTVLMPETCMYSALTIHFTRNILLTVLMPETCMYSALTIRNIALTVHNA